MATSRKRPRDCESSESSGSAIFKRLHVSSLSDPILLEGGEGQLSTLSNDLPSFFTTERVQDLAQLVNSLKGIVGQFDKTYESSDEQKKYKAVEKESGRLTLKHFEKLKENKQNQHDQFIKWENGKAAAKYKSIANELKQLNFDERLFNPRDVLGEPLKSVFSSFGMTFKFVMYELENSSWSENDAVFEALIAEYSKSRSLVVAEYKARLAVLTAKVDDSKAKQSRTTEEEITKLDQIHLIEKQILQLKLNWFNGILKCFVELFAVYIQEGVVKKFPAQAEVKDMAQREYQDDLPPLPLSGSGRKNLNKKMLAQATPKLEKFYGPNSIFSEQKMSSSAAPQLAKLKGEDVQMTPVQDVEMNVGIKSRPV